MMATFTTSLCSDGNIKDTLVSPLDLENFFFASFNTAAILSELEAVRSPRDHSPRRSSAVVRDYVVP